MKSQTAISQLLAIKRLITKETRLAVEFSESWKSLISTILSSQTRDTTTIYYSEILYKKYSSLKKLSKAKLNDVKKIIKPINFYKTKAKNIIETSRIIEEEYGGKIPDNREELMELPGVGRKVANVYLVHNHNSDCIGIDTHVNFLAHQLRWTKEKTQEKIERDLERLFPKRYWNSINWILVRFGQNYPSRKKQIEILKKHKILE